MKNVTGRLDGGAIVSRALRFANMEDLSDAAAVCKDLKVLPPGAPYRIDSVGRVYPLPHRTREQSALLKRRRKQLNGALENLLRGGSPAGVRLPKFTTVDVSFEWARWWRIQTITNGRVVDDDAFIVPTLDALIAVAMAVLWQERRRLGRCAYRECGKYFFRWSGRRQSFCSLVCRDKEQRLRTKFRVRKMRRQAAARRYDDSW